MKFLGLPRRLWLAAFDSFVMPGMPAGYASTFGMDASIAT